MIQQYDISIMLVLPSMAALSAPSSVSFSIQGDSVLVKWKHLRGEEPTHGYYVIVQEILERLRLDAPDFVHVDRNVMSVKIKGLKPAAAYEMKVQPEITSILEDYPCPGAGSGLLR